MVGWPRLNVAVKSQMHTGAWAFQRQRVIDSLVGSPSALSKPAAFWALAQSTGTVISRNLPRSRTGSSIVTMGQFYIDNHRWSLTHAGLSEAGSAAKAVSCPLCKLLGRRVDHRLPVQPLEVRHIRSVEGLEVGPAHKSQAEHMAVRLRRSPIHGQVEALVAKVGIEAQRSRDALGQILHVGF